MSERDTTRGLVMVAEDELDLLRLLQRRLEHAGFEVIPISDGMTLRTLLKAALAGQPGYRLPDILVSDIDMPGLDALTALRQTPESLGRVPVILITGTAQPPDRAEAGVVGAHKVICKPFEFSELLEAIEALLPSAPPIAP